MLYSAWTFRVTFSVGILQSERFLPAQTPCNSSMKWKVLRMFHEGFMKESRRPGYNGRHIFHTDHTLIRAERQIINTTCSHLRVEVSNSLWSCRGLYRFILQYLPEYARGI